MVASMRAIGIALALYTATAAFGGVDSRLVGTWTADATTIKVGADGTCSVGAEGGKCQTVLDALFYQAPNGQVVNDTWKVAGDELSLSGNGIDQTFRRAPEAPARAPATKAGWWTQAQWGVEFALPAGWKAVERESTVLLGSETEPGLILVRFMPRTDRQKLAAAYSQGLQEGGHGGELHHRCTMVSVKLVVLRAPCTRTTTRKYGLRALGCKC